MSAALTVEARWLLSRIAGGDVTWRSAGRGVSYRVWVNEDTTETVTRRARRLIDAGLARRCELPWRTGRGWVELTAAGEEAVARATSAPAGVARRRGR